MTKYLLLLLVVLSGGLSMQAQDRVTEEDVNTQKVFIDAEQEKILGNYESAAFLFKEVLKRDSDNHAAAYELARIYDILNDDEKAIKSAKAATNLDDTNTWYKSFLADLYKKTGQDNKAAEIYEGLVKSEPNNDYYYFRWAYFLVRANQINQAVKVYDNLEKRMGINEEIIRRKHALYVGAGNHKKAVKEYERLIDAFPKNTDYYHLLASFYEQVGDQKQANLIHKKILNLDPDDVISNIAIAGANSGSLNEVTYLLSLKPIFEKPDVDIDVKIKELFPYVQKVADTGDRNLADATLELSTILEEVHANEAKAFSISGDLLYYSGQKEDALKKYEKTVALNESVFLVWEQMMYIHSEEKSYEQLEEVSQEVMDLFPNQPRAYYFYALARNKQDDHKEAISILEQALLMVGKDARLKFDIHALMGNAYSKLGKYKLSDTAYEEALKLNPNAPSLLNEYSRTLSERGEKLTKAKEMSGLANELYPGKYEFQDTYGWVLYKLKEFEIAKEWLNKAIENGGDSQPDVLERYGDTLFQMQDINGAMKNWQKAVEKGSDSEILEKKIADRKLYE